MSCFFNVFMAFRRSKRGKKGEEEEEEEEHAQVDTVAELKNEEEDERRLSRLQGDVSRRTEAGAERERESDEGTEEREAQDDVTKMLGEARNGAKDVREELKKAKEENEILRRELDRKSRRTRELVHWFREEHASREAETREKLRLQGRLDRIMMASMCAEPHRYEDMLRRQEDKINSLELEVWKRGSRATLMRKNAGINTDASLETEELDEKMREIEEREADVKQKEEAVEKREQEALEREEAFTWRRKEDVEEMEEDVKRRRKEIEEREKRFRARVETFKERRKAMKERVSVLLELKNRSDLRRQQLDRRKDRPTVLRSRSEPMANTLTDSSYEPSLISSIHNPPFEPCDCNDFVAQVPEEGNSEKQLKETRASLEIKKQKIEKIPMNSLLVDQVHHGLEVIKALTKNHKCPDTRGYNIIMRKIDLLLDDIC